MSHCKVNQYPNSPNRIAEKPSSIFDAQEHPGGGSNKIHPPLLRASLEIDHILPHVYPNSGPLVVGSEVGAAVED